MFRALLCPSSGARDYDVDYHIGRIVLGLLCVGGKLQLGWSGVWCMVKIFKWFRQGFLQLSVTLNN